MRTIKSTLDSVIGRDASKGRTDLHQTHSDHSRYLREGSEMLGSHSGAPAELPDMVADRFEARTEIQRTPSGSKKATAPVPTILAASRKAGGSDTTILAASRRAAGSDPTILTKLRKASASTPPTLSNQKIDAAVSSTILPHQKDESAVAPTVVANPKKASAVISMIAGRSPNASVDAFEQAYHSLLPELRALRRSEVKPVNIGIPGAVTKALQIQPTLAGLRDRIAEVSPEVDPRLPDRLVTHALALSHAHALFLTASHGVDALPSLSTEGRQLRAVLLADAQRLIRRGLIETEAIRRLRADNGYHTLAFDLQILAELLRTGPASSTGIAFASAAELQRAQELAVTILTLLGRRKRLRAGVEAAADLRRRAFTLFARVYDETRRVVLFLCRQEGDADQLVPSLHAKHNTPNKRQPTNTTNEMQ
jgi:hypothetical protein